MDEASESFTIGRLAAEAGVTVEAIRFYQREELLRQPGRAGGTFRRYDQTDVARVRFIKAAQGLGFSLSDVAQLLRLEDGTQCHRARTIAAGKLADIRRKLAELHRIEEALAELVDRCGSAQGKVRCPLITHLQEDSRTSATAAGALRAKC